MPTLADGLMAYLAGTGIGLADSGAGVNLFDRVAAEPADLVAVIEDGGPGPDITLPLAGQPIARRAKVRVVVRGSYAFASAKAGQVYAKLTKPVPGTYGGVEILYAVPAGELVNRGQDGLDRYYWEFPVLVTARYS